MQEHHIKLPPWSKKRRIITTIVCTGFILLTSGFIGLGLYQIGVDSGIITPAMTKDSLLLTLLNDAQFIRTVKHAAQKRECINPQKKFKLTYEYPLHLTKVTSTYDNCTLLVTTHPTGSTVEISLKEVRVNREKLVQSMVKEFKSVQTDFLSGTAYETSALSGNRNGIATTVYVINAGQEASWIITYLPTSSLFDGAVLEMAESFRLL